ncbi:FG-GAP-like repeat-containing protein [Aquisphaera insulae]|uniref:FG-GAP-like repeat-containing protein n=1 Tax=Aquisphaera insulae TaxID=2712864 RepID=UPI0013E9DC78|nr:FG-GAP-like repeat-containing protein [Aquisphaera insulae]
MSSRLALKKRILALETLESRRCLTGIAGVSYLDQVASDRIRVAVDFTAAMAPGPAADPSNYAVGSETTAGLRVLSAIYSDSGSSHRTILTVSTAGIGGGDYTVRVNGPTLRDAAGIPMAAAVPVRVAVHSNTSNVLTIVGGDGGSIGTVGDSIRLGYGRPESVSAADLDGDGLPDLVILLDRGKAPDGTSLWRVATQRNLGGGRFDAPVVLDDTPTIPPASVAVVDWNRDGHTDIVVGELTGRDQATVLVYLNDGKGHFAEDPDSPIPLPNNANYTGTSFAPGLAALWNGSLDGNGQILVISRDPYVGYSLSESLDLRTAEYPTGYAIADFNEDGKPDIVAATSRFGYWSSEGVYYYASTASGRAAAVTLDYPHNDKPGTVRAGDFNGDRHLDLVVVTDLTAFAYSGDPIQTSITTLLGDGRGHFSPLPGTIIDRAGLTLGADPADLDGDGRLDLALSASDGGVWIFRGDGRGGFTATASAPSASSETSGVASTAIADIDGDGKLDVVLGNATLSTIRIFTNRGNGLFSPSDVPGPTLGSNTRSASDGGPAMAQADVNGDGLPDWIKLEPSGIAVFLASADGRFGEPILSSSGPRDNSRLRVGDLNNDGRPDVVLLPGRGGATIGVLLGRGDGRFDLAPTTSPAVSSGETTGLFEGEFADVNGDGYLDLVASLSHSEGYDVVPYAYAVLFGDGTGTLRYNANTVVRASFPTGGWSFGPVNLGDYDGDGKADILGITGAGLTLFHGQGNGKFAASVTSSFGGDAERFLPADLDGDGKLDLVGYSATYLSNRSISVLKGDGTGRFTEWPSLDAGERMALLALGDVNGDGKTDIVFSYNDTFGGTSAVSVMAGDGTGHFGSIQSIAVPASPWSVTSAPMQPFLTAGRFSLGAIRFESSAASVSEGGGNASIRVIRLGDASSAASVDYRLVAGMANAGSDYADLSGTLAFAAGETVKFISIPILNDSQHEPDEDFRVVLGNASGAFLGEPATFHVTIGDDDPIRHGVFQFQTTTTTVSESAGSLQVIIDRVGGSDGTVSVDYTAGSLADDGSPNMHGQSGLVWFEPGETSKVIDLFLLDDAVAAGDEAALLRLWRTSGGATIGIPSTMDVTILDDDPPPSPGARHPGEFNFSDSYAVHEDAGSIWIPVTRSGGADGSVTVQVVIAGGDAAAGTNYAWSGQTLVFDAGETSKSVRIPLLRDGQANPTRILNLALQSPLGGATLGAASTTTLRILNVDQAFPGDPAGGDPPAQPTSDPPAPVTVASVAAVLDRKKNLTQIVVTFSAPIGPRAATAAFYRLAAPGKKNSYDAKNAKVYRLRSVDLAADGRAVTITLAKPMKVSATLQLRLTGQGLTDSHDRPIDGDRDGVAGGNATALIGRRGVTMQAVMQRA